MNVAWLGFLALLLFTIDSRRAVSAFFLGSVPHYSSGAILWSTSSDDTTTRSVGFIGFGTIALAIAKGLIRNNDNRPKIALSKRSLSKSAEFQQLCPDCKIFDNNQDIVDCSDILFITVLPQQTRAVLDELTLSGSRRTLISLVSTVSLSELEQYSRLPKSCLYKMICLPVVAYGKGVCLLQSAGHANNNIKQFLSPLGTVVWADDDRHMSAMMVVAGSTMGLFYGILRQHRDWLLSTSNTTSNNNMTKAQCSQLVLTTYQGMLHDAMERHDESSEQLLEQLIDEQTVGGLNEQALKNLKSLNVMNSYDRVMDAVFARITGEGDGSLQ